LFFETSAKSNINVSNAFDETGSQLFLNYIKTRTSTSNISDIVGDGTNISIKNEPKKKSCC
jgi:hypothetical protein